MPDELQQPNSDYIRLLIREAVERELVTQTAPLRSQQQIHIGQLRQLNQDYGAVKAQLEDLAAIVRGDEKLGIAGLMTTVNTIAKQMADYNRKLEDQSDRIKDLGIFIRIGFAIVISLGIVDNQRITTFIGNILRSAGLGL